MSFQLLKALIKEVIQLPKSIYTELETQILASNFWEEPNDMDDVKAQKSPLSIKLQHAIQKALSLSGMDVDAQVKVIKNSPLDPDQSNIVAYAEQSGDIKGRETLILMLHSGNLTERPDIHPNDLVEQISEILRHELVHNEQLRKQSQSLGITMKQAEKRRQKDATQLYAGDDQEKYFALKNEIDAFGHQAADEMIRRYGKEKALQVISLSQDNPNLPDPLKQFPPLKKLKDPKARARLKSRIYSYIQQM